jgi:adenylate cyclase class 2
MSTEIEAKFRIADPELFRQTLRRLGAAPLGKVLEVNRICDTPDRRLLGADCGLRIRTQEPLDCVSLERSAPALLTYKGPRQPGVGNVKSRAEHETAIADADAALTILASLGFQPVIVYEKHREAWQLGSCEVSLDELPRLGWWLEVEGPNEPAVQAAIQQLGLTETPTRQTYVEMAAAHGDPDAQGCRRLAFGRSPA